MSADGDPMDVDALTKGKGKVKGHETGKSSKNESKDANGQPVGQRMFQL